MREGEGRGRWTARTIFFFLNFCDLLPLSHNLCFFTSLALPPFLNQTLSRNQLSSFSLSHFRDRSVFESFFFPLRAFSFLGKTNHDGSNSSFRRDGARAAPGLDHGPRRLGGKDRRRAPRRALRQQHRHEDPVVARGPGVGEWFGTLFFLFWLGCPTKADLVDRRSIVKLRLRRAPPFPAKPFYPLASYISRNAQLSYELGAMRAIGGHSRHWATPRVR